MAPQGPVRASEDTWLREHRENRGRERITAEQAELWTGR